jgi:hypothetical protein
MMCLPPAAEGPSGSRGVSLSDVFIWPMLGVERGVMGVWVSLVVCCVVFVGYVCWWGGAVGSGGCRGLCGVGG